MSHQKVVIIKLGSMGDILQASCMIDAIHDQMDVELHVLTYDRHKSLVEFNPNVQNVETISMSFLGKIHAFFILFFGRYNVAFIAHRSSWLDFLCWCARISYRSGFSSPEKSSFFLTSSSPFDLSKSRHFRYLSLVSTVTGKALNADAYLSSFYPNPTVELSYRISGPYIVIAPFGGENPWSSMPTRVWEHYDELINVLLRDYHLYHIVLVGSPLEASKLKSLMNNHPRIQCFTESIHELALLLRDASLFIGNDSFPLFMSITQSCVSIGIFGPTNASLIIGDFKDVKYIQSSVSCSPCYNPMDGLNGVAYLCPYSKKCMANIAVEDVMQLVCKIL